MEVTQFVVEQIKQLVAAMQGPAQDVYRIYVRQAVIDGWVGVGAVAFSWMVLCFWLYFGRGVRKSIADPDLKYVVQFCTGALLVVFTAVTIIYVPSGIQKILNPDYYAIQWLIRGLR